MSLAKKPTEWDRSYLCMRNCIDIVWISEVEKVVTWT
jgi:hypothetical protein